MQYVGRVCLLLLVVLVSIGILGVNFCCADFVTYGNGFGSKWGDPAFGTASDTITWTFMNDGTSLAASHPLLSNPLGPEVTGTSSVSSLRSSFDTANGAGTFNQAIQNAFNTWSAAASGRINFQFVPIDTGAPGGDSSNAGSYAVDIRIGAFNSVAGSNFAGLGSVGYGPPGNDLNPTFHDALAGDVVLNSNSNFFVAPGAEGSTYYNGVGVYKNDLESLMLHELGHAAIGLGHPANGLGDVMYVGAGAANIINRQLSPDDIAGARTVYGVPEPSSGLYLIAVVISGFLSYRRKSRA